MLQPVSADYHPAVWAGEEMQLQLVSGEEEELPSCTELSGVRCNGGQRGYLQGASLDPPNEMHQSAPFSSAFGT